jgi:uncharacterized protein YkwD
MIRACALLSAVTVFLIGMAGGRAPAADGYDTAAEQQLIQLINQARSQEGLPPLQQNTQLLQAARAHSELMASRQTLSHQLPREPILRKRLALSGLRFHTDGENVAFNQNAEAAHQGLMHSSPHRAIILSPVYNAVGVGAVERDGTLWITEDFARLR